VSALATSIGPFALPTGILVLLICAAVAALVGRFVGRRQHVGISGALTDMLLAAGVAARIAFVAIWFEHYRAAPWTILDIRDGGFTPWAGLIAAIAVALWQGWRRAALRGPLTTGLLAGALVWAVSPAILRLGTGPTLSDLEGVALVTLQGSPESLARVANGKPVVVNLWATWCPPCRREMPVLAAAQQQLPGVNFIFADQGEDPATVRKYISDRQLVLANVLLDTRKKLGEQAGSVGLPTTLFFDANGQLIDTHIGALSDASLASKLKKLEPPGP
jgi:thiol-disulfide isomerase/thioredoxin